MTLIEELLKVLEDTWNDGYVTADSGLDETPEKYTQDALNRLREILSGQISYWSSPPQLTQELHTWLSRDTPWTS
jgi:hypothetical protein